MERSETRYVEVGDAQVAFQVIGHGARDLLFCYGLGSHLELLVDWPEDPNFADRLAAFSRLIWFDRRGTGASDAVSRSSIATWEEWAEDLGAVLDAAGSERAAIFATLDAGALAIPFVATHPERVSALVLCNTAARYLWAEDYPIGVPADTVDAFLDIVASSWGTDAFTALINPGAALNQHLLSFGSKLIRASATPNNAHAQYQYLLRNLDVRKILPLIHVPTLVLQVRENPVVPLELGKYLADHIENARFIEIPGGELGFVEPMGQMVAEEIAEFLTGERPNVEVDRVLTTVLFTDIVGSTELLAEKGDHEWHRLLDAHDRSVRDHLRRYRGREVKTTGDGFLASFDGPARAIRCAQAVAAATSRLGLTLRIGLHTGECEVRGDDLSGMAVHVAARIMGQAKPGEVLVSNITKELVVGSGTEFSDRGEHELKGAPGPWRLYAVCRPGAL